MAEQGGHWFTSKTQSKHGRKYKEPFWARGNSFEIGTKRQTKETKKVETDTASTEETIFRDRQSTEVIENTTTRDQEIYIEEIIDNDTEGKESPTTHKGVIKAGDLRDKEDATEYATEGKDSPATHTGEIEAEDLRDEEDATEYATEGKESPATHTGEIEAEDLRDEEDATEYATEGKESPATHKGVLEEEDLRDEEDAAEDATEGKESPATHKGVIEEGDLRDEEDATEDATEGKESTATHKEVIEEEDLRDEEDATEDATEGKESPATHKGVTEEEDLRDEEDATEFIDLPPVSRLMEFDIDLEYKLWKEIKPTQVNPKTLTRGWTETVSNLFNKVIPGCVLCFKYHNIQYVENPEKKRGGNYFDAKAHCKHDDCGIFKFTMKERPRKKHNQTAKIRVSVIKPIKEHRKEDVRMRQLRGKKRKMYQEELKDSKASKLHYEILGEMDETEVKEGNYTKCQTTEVLRKAKSQWKVYDNLHEDPFTELTITSEILAEEDITSKDVKGYVQEICFKPFQVVLYKEQSLNVAKDAIKSGNGVFYLDATGSVVSKLGKSQILYYALIVKSALKGKPPVPVLEFLSERQGTFYIVRPLLTFFGKLQTISPNNWQPERLEIDFSWALVHSVLLAVNKMSVEEYLNVTFKIVDGKAPKDALTVVHLCAAHMLKSIRNLLRDKFSDSKLRELLVRIFALFQTARGLRETTGLWETMCVVFGNIYMSVEVEEGIRRIKHMVLTAEIDEFDGDLICNESYDDEDKSNKVQRSGIRASSPFTTVYRSIQMKTKKRTSVSADGEDNPYYSEEVLDVFGRQYLPLIPLWSGMMLGNVKRHSEGGHVNEINRDSNAPVENWMKIVKEDTLLKRKRLRVGNFVRSMHTVLKGRLYEYTRDSKTGKRKKVEDGGGDDGDDDDANVNEGKAKTKNREKTKEKERKRKMGTDNVTGDGEETKKSETRHDKRRKLFKDKYKKKETVFREDDDFAAKKKGETARPQKQMQEEKAEFSEEKWKRRQHRGSEREPFYYTPPKHFPTPKAERNIKNKGLARRRSLARDKGQKTKSAQKTTTKHDNGSTLIPGIRNVQNTCWLISSLQSLAALKNINCAEGGGVGKSVQDVLTKIRKADTNQVNIEQLKAAVDEHIPFLEIGQQQDAAIFLTYLTDTADTDLKMDMMSTLHCTICRQNKSKPETMSLMPAEIPVVSLPSIKSCIQEFSKEEILMDDNSVYCDNCMEPTTQTKHYDVTEVNNNVITIQLKRYERRKSGIIMKNTHPVHVDRILCIEGHVLKYFRVAAIQCHLGKSLRAGHYVTFTVDDEGCVMRCDDTHVTREPLAVLNSEEVEENCYILYYQRIEISNPFLDGRSYRGQDHPLITGLCGMREAEVVSVHQNITLKRSDLIRLNEGGWLNDQIVNFYFRAIERACPNVAVVDTFFYTAMKENRTTDRFLKPSAFRKDKLLIPVEENNHWFLLVLDTQAKSVKTLDSSVRTNTSAVTLRNFLEKNPKYPSEWKLDRLKNLPKQNNFNDCGVFMCQYAVCQAYNIAITFSQADMSSYRRGMKVECLTGQLFPRF